MAQTEVNQFEAYNMFLQDYRDTQNGVLPPVGASEFEFSQSEHPDERLPQLRRTIASFAVGTLGYDVVGVARDLSLDPNVLIDDIKQDEALIHLTSSYIDRSLRPEKGREQTLPIDFEKIGWVETDETVLKIPEAVETDELSYYFVDITDFHDATKSAVEHLKREGVKDNLYDILKHTSIVNLHKAIATGKGGNDTRPVNYIKGNKHRNINTTYPTYKVGIHGPQNRALIMRLEDKDNKPVYALAAICDHEDQDKLFRTLTR